MNDWLVEKNVELYAEDRNCAIQILCIALILFAWVIGVVI